MQGLWLEEQQLVLRHDLPVPSASERGEALVRVLRAGVCNTDVELTRGYYPFRGVLGHEFVGEVVAGAEELLGQRVVGEINAVCHQCPTCRAGRPRHCERRTVLGIVGRDGAFAEYLALPAENLLVVPDSVSTDAATFVEPLAAALEIREQVRVRPSDRVLVVGDGKLGQLIARSFASSGCELLVVGRHRRKLALLADAGIAARDATEGAELPPRSYDAAVECTGSPQGFATALEALRPRGTLVMKSTYAGTLTFDAARVVVDELTLVGSRCGPFRPALRLLAEGAVDPTPLIDARYPLADGVAALEHAQRPGVLKVLLEMV